MDTTPSRGNRRRKLYLPGAVVPPLRDQIGARVRVGDEPHAGKAVPIHLIADDVIVMPDEKRIGV